MSLVIVDDRIPDIQAQQRLMIRRQVLELFSLVDHLLDVHRSTFVFREYTPAQLEQHKQAIPSAIRICLVFNTIIADPDFDEPDLAARLQVRIRQLQDAYETFHDPTLSNEQADGVLKKVFAE
jgi:hypothetical protein